MLFGKRGLGFHVRVQSSPNMRDDMASFDGEFCYWAGQNLISQVSANLSGFKSFRKSSIDPTSPTSRARVLRPRVSCRQSRNCQCRPPDCLLRA
jgi:hypothetical protein